MQIAFPPLDPRAAASPQQALARPDPLSDEARTAGPAIPVYTPSAQPASFNQALDGTTKPAAAKETAPSFGDFIDMINPLQHIPLVNLLYRNLTGDQIGGAAQVVGGALFGGPIGAIAGTATAIAEYQTGQSLTDVTVAAFSGESLSAPARAVADFTGPVTKRYNFNQTV